MAKALTIRFPAAMWEAIEAIKKSRLDDPDAGSIVRELVAEAILTRKKQKS